MCFSSIKSHTSVIVQPFEGRRVSPRRPNSIRNATPNFRQTITQHRNKSQPNQTKQLVLVAAYYKQKQNKQKKQNTNSNQKIRTKLYKQKKKKNSCAYNRINSYKKCTTQQRTNKQFIVRPRPLSFVICCVLFLYSSISLYLALAFYLSFSFLFYIS